MGSFSLYGVNFKRMTKVQLLDSLFRSLEAGEQTTVFTPNLEMLAAAKGSKSVCSILNSANILVPDGVGISLACKRNHILPPDAVAGIDIAYSLLRRSCHKGYRIFLLGGKDGVAELAAKNLEKQLPDLCICGTHNGYFDKDESSEQNKSVIEIIRAAHPDVVFVCFGFPLQERWIIGNKGALPDVNLFMGLGGSLDVWSGKLRRAPKLFRSLGLEWLWRCVRQPRRIFPLLKNTIRLLL
jgi:N-acetylglucosaminyldiphosphoundecaprenol N-acetyl-beta-D-mannosaminyltransferase